MQRLMVAALMAAVVAGCAGTGVVPPPERPAGFPHHTLATVLGKLPTPDSLWSSFSGSLAIAYSIPEESGTLNALISYRRADSVLLRFRAPLGLEVSRALITQDSMFVYDRLKRDLYVGQRSVADRMLPVGFWRSDMASAVFGYEDLQGERWALSVDSLHYILTAADGTRRLLVDPAYWRVVAADRFDASGTIVEMRRFADFDRVDGRYLPRRIVTSRPDRDVRASISIRRIEPDPPRLSFDLRLPSNVERIPVH